ncbi:hypothetical protein CORC01_09409 [Colletotrichum orchidophilum]|uniref:Zn(2)-C6 fungal-type domain-containing protein n=1 Tax=Colletotrichum orchidophilum TaxID=1209926 RepID=A0A1G4B1J4_9PEZI|nr:uncharacterized protein CORC01_09409 [Colletotrichum orchidophilum]OHE95264.1 hypothetical protein CORC01_09409 [Colletotrichum orchidophilum]
MDTLPPPPRPDSPPRRLRACEPCTRAKARCHFREENARRHLCDRCERLNVDCSAKTKGVRKTRQIKPLVNRIATLEKQIAHLVTPEKSPADSTPNDARATPSTSPPPCHARRNEPHSTAALIHRPPAGPITHLSSSSVTTTITPPLGLTWSQAANILADFRANFVPNFPFVQIDGPAAATGSPQRLARDKPFLFRAIMLVAAPVSKSRAEVMHREVLADMGRRLLLEEEGGLDLLQGMLVVIMWAECKYWFDKQITRLVYAALGYAHSLGITKPPRSLLQSTRLRSHYYPEERQPEDCFSMKASFNMTEHHTLEEQRTFLGLFCVVTANCTQFSRRQNPLLPSLWESSGGGRDQGIRGPHQLMSREGGLAYLDVCCEILTASGTVEDRMAARMFKMAATSAQITDGFGPVLECGRGLGMGVGFEEEAGRIQAGVEGVLEGLDARDPYYAYLRLQHLALLVQLYEPATKPSFSSSSSSQPTPPQYSSFQSIAHRRVTYLQAALSAARSYFDAVLALPPEAYLYHTSVDTGLSQGALAVTTRLLVLTGVEGWDLKRARDSFGFAETCDNLAAFLRRVLQAGRERVERLKEETWVRNSGRGHATAGFDGWEEANGGEFDVRESSCEDLIGKMGWIKEWYQTRVQTEESGMTAGGVGREAVNKDLMEEIARIWQWPADTASVPIFSGLINPFDICYEGT